MQFFAGHYVIAHRSSRVRHTPATFLDTCTENGIIERSGTFSFQECISEDEESNIELNAEVEHIPSPIREDAGSIAGSDDDVLLIDVSQDM